MFRVFALALATTAIPTLASAQTAPAPAAAPAAAPAVAPGATIYDTAGGVVGTVESVTGGNAVINTGSIKAGVALTSLATGPKGPIMSMTKAELEAAAGQSAAQAAADFKAKLVAGSAVYGTGGASLGTIKAVDAQFVTLTTAKGEAKLPIAGFGPGPNGVTLGMTAEQLDAAMGGSTAPAATPNQ